MRELSYRAHDGRTIDLDGNVLWVADLQDMRANAWTYTLAARGIKGVSRSAITSKMTIRTKQPTLLDDVCALFDMDMQAQRPGTITVNGEWGQRAYVVASSLGMLPMPDYAQVDCTVVLCDGVWRKALPTQHFFPAAAPRPAHRPRHVQDRDARLQSRSPARGIRCDDLRPVL